MSRRTLKEPRFQSELKEAIRIVESAGKKLLSLYERPIDVETKSDGTKVSRADRETAVYITDELRRLFPDHAILNEEQREDGSRFQRLLCWVVDPLDGTKEYLAKIPDFGVMIGLLENFRPVLGVTLKPLKNELAYAAIGQGAYVVDSRGKSPLHVSDSDSVHAIVSRSRRSRQLKMLLAAVEPAKTSQMGGSLKTIEVARGAANLFLCPPRSTMHLWDLCAPSAILVEAGGRLTDAFGQPIDYAQAETANRKGVVAASAVIHDRIVNSIAPVLE